MSTAYESLVASAKVAARDILRMRKIAKWATEKANAEADFEKAKESNERIMSRYEKCAAVAEYEAQHCPVDHPAVEDKLATAKTERENAENGKKSQTEYFERLSKTYEERIKAAETAIEEWNTGVRKVNAEDLQALTNKLVEENVTEAFRAVSAESK